MGNSITAERHVDVDGLTGPIDLLSADVEHKEAEGRWLVDRAAVLKYKLRVLEGLATGWQDAEPGTSGPSYRLVGTADGRPPVLPRELLPEGTEVFEGTLEEWREAGGPRGVVPPDIKVVGMDELSEAAVCVTCPGCGEEHPLVEETLQPDGNPRPGAWIKRRIVVCGTEEGIYLVSSEEGNERP